MRALGTLWAVYVLTLVGCWRQSDREVVVYTALDAEFSRPVFEDFSKTTGLEVLPKFDVESTKTVGLVEEIIAERRRPRCDVFWNNEILHTLRLERLGLLAEYHSSQAKEFPAAFRSPRGTWHGFAARARVLIVNKKLVQAEAFPTSIEDLAAPRWRGKTAIAKPLFGTTATHAACLFAVWGDRRAGEFFARVKQNAQVLSGNKQVARAVAAGQAAFGLTDTDDAVIELESGMPVAIVYPDQATGAVGTLFIPNTVAILRDCPHPEEARRLVDFLLSAETEARLAAGPSAQIPLRMGAAPPNRVRSPETVRAMKVDFAEAAAGWPKVARRLRDEFARAP